MTYGPMQLIVIGFGQSALPLDVVNQLRRLRDDGVVRLVDAVYVSKDEHGDLTEIKASDLSDDEVVLLGMLSGALFGYGAAGESGMELGAELGGMAAAESGEFGLDSDDIDEIADLYPAAPGRLPAHRAPLGNRPQRVDPELERLRHCAWLGNTRNACRNGGGSDGRRQRRRRLMPWSAVGKRRHR